MSTNDELNKMIKDLATLKDNNDNGILKDENGKTTSKINLVLKIREKRSQIKSFQHTKGYQDVDVDSEVKKLINQFNKQKSSKSSGSDTQAPRTMEQIPPAPHTKFSSSNIPQNPHQVNPNLLKLQTSTQKKKADAEKEKWRKQVRETAKKEEAKLLKEQQEKEISDWKKKSVEVAMKIQQLKTSGEFDIEESTVRNLINEIRPDPESFVVAVINDKKEKIKLLKGEWVKYEKRKEQHEAKVEKEQKLKLEMNSIKPLTLEVDNFIKTRFDEETYKNYVEVAGIKIIETQIKKDYNKLLSEKFDTLNLTLKESKAKLDNLRKNLRQAYTGFLSKLNEKAKAIEKKKRDEEKKQRELEQKRKAEEKLKIKRDAELKERLRKKAWEEGQAKEQAKIRRLEIERKNLERKQKLEELNTRREEQRKKAEINKTNQKLLNQFTVFIKNPQKGYDNLTTTLTELKKLEPNNNWQELLLHTAEIRLDITTKVKAKTKKTENFNSNLISECNGILLKIEKHNNTVQEKEKLDAFVAKKIKLLLIKDTTITYCKQVITACVDTIKIRDEATNNNQEIGQLNIFLPTEKSLNLPKPYIHRSGWAKVSFAATKERRKSSTTSPTQLSEEGKK